MNTFLRQAGTALQRAPYKLNGPVAPRTLAAGLATKTKKAKQLPKTGDLHGSGHEFTPQTDGILRPSIAQDIPLLHRPVPSKTHKKGTTIGHDANGRPVIANSPWHWTNVFEAEGIFDSQGTELDRMVIKKRTLPSNYKKNSQIEKLMRTAGENSKGLFRIEKPVQAVMERYTEMVRSDAEYDRAVAMPYGNTHCRPDMTVFRQAPLEFAGESRSLAVVVGEFKKEGGSFKDALSQCIATAAAVAFTNNFLPRYNIYYHALRNQFPEGPTLEQEAIKSAFAELKNTVMDLVIVVGENMEHYTVPQAKLLEYILSRGSVKNPDLPGLSLPEARQMGTRVNIFDHPHELNKILHTAGCQYHSNHVRQSRPRTKESEFDKFFGP